jgi:hypothetical protein
VARRIISSENDTMSVTFYGTVRARGVAALRRVARAG